MHVCADDLVGGDLDMDLLCMLLRDGPISRVLEDASIRAGLASYWEGAFGTWQTADGHRPRI